MNLKPIKPPLKPGQLVRCSHCAQLTDDAMADLADKAMTFYCGHCLKTTRKAGGLA